MNLKVKLLLLILILLLAAGGAELYMAKQARQRQRQQRQNAKAEETSITIIEGWTIKDIAQHLDNDPQREGLPHIVATAAFEQAAESFDAADYPILSSKPASASLEGFLFPDTYRFLTQTLKQGDSEPETVSKAIIKKQLDTFVKKFTPQMQQQAQDQGLTVYQAVILASVIEKEAGRSTPTPEAKQKLEEERRLIAGVFYNRLRAGLPLQSDATVNYITKKKTPAASSADLEINSPYNTYKYPGLPPGPISNPSLAALEAAVNPADTDYMYFLHKQPSGEAVFSKTFEEHVINKQKFLK